MKRLTSLVAALVVAASVNAASVYVSYYQDDAWLGSAQGYVDPYVAQLTGAPITFTATVPAGYHVTDWLTSSQENGIQGLDTATSTGNKSDTYVLREYSTTADYYLAVRWYQVAYYLHYDTDGGTDCPANSGPWYSQNASATVGTYSGTKTGYDFSHWYWEAGGVSVANGEVFAGATKFNLQNENDVVINLKAIWTPHAWTCDFMVDSVHVNSLTLTYGRGDGNDVSGFLPTKAGYVFDGWYVYTGTDEVIKAWNSDGTWAAGMIWDSSGNFHHDSGFMVEAHWTPAPYSLTTAVAGNGSVSPSGTRNYAYGTSVELTATPNTGWLFSRWQDGPTANPRTVTIVGDATYTAVFTQKLYAVTFRYYNGNAAWVSETQNVSYNEDAVPPSMDSVTNCPGRTFSGWQGSYVRVDSIREIEARYNTNAYNVLYDPNCENPSGSMSGSFGHQCYVQWNLPANQFSRPGYTFVEWNAKADGTGAHYGDEASVNNLAYGNGETITLYAQWAPITYAIEFSGGSGAEGEMAAISPVVYDSAVTLPANAFSKPGCEFQHWTLGGVTYADGATVSNLTTTAGATVILVATWDAPFWVEYYPNGGDGAMGVQRFETGETKALFSNEFHRVGYVFAGWATNAAEAAMLNVKYADGEIVHDIGDVAETNTLFAVWSTNTYWVAFDANGGTGDPMSPQRFVYDQAQNLSSNTYSRGELWRFGGWSNVVDGAVYVDGEAVSNLCAEADGTNTLVVVWEDNRSNLSKAMHCVNLQWTNVTAGTGNPWNARFDTGLGYNRSGSCAEQKGRSLNLLTAAVSTNGVISFRTCNPSSVETTMWLCSNTVNDQAFVTAEVREEIIFPADGDWHEHSFSVDFTDERYSIVKDKIYIHIFCDTSDGIVQIDQMKWTPEGAEPENPEPTEADVVEPSAVVVDGTQMTISFTGDAQFSYHLLATDSLSPTNWYPYGETNVGSGAAQTLPVAIDAEHSQRFFKIETIQKHTP